MEKITYSRLYKMNKLEARKILLETLKTTSYNITRAANELQCSRNTVRKFMRREKNNISLNDFSRKPKRIHYKIKKDIIENVIRARKETNYGRVRLRAYLFIKYEEILSPNTIAYILRKNGLSKPQKKRSKFKAVSYYKWQEIWENYNPLQFFQVDLKEILDLKTLPEEIYRHISKYKLPKYQWTAIDPITKMKFLSFSFEKSIGCGLSFIKLLCLWLRTFGITHKFYIQTDWGEEFGGKSFRKLEKLQKIFFEPLNSQLLRIRKSRPQDNPYVERTHRIDDEEFYIPYLKSIFDLPQFFRSALKWVYVYNYFRFHFGRGMGGQPPFYVLRKMMPQVDERICVFPPIILDYIAYDKKFYLQGGQYVYNMYKI